jgi:hypothetical protein
VDLPSLKRVLSSCNTACNAVFRSSAYRKSYAGGAAGSATGAFYAVVIPMDSSPLPPRSVH